MSAVERHGRQNGKGDQAGRPSRLSQTGQSNGDACVQGRLSTDWWSGLSTLAPNTYPASRREREGNGIYATASLAAFTGRPLITLRAVS